MSDFRDNDKPVLIDINIDSDDIEVTTQVEQNDETDKDSDSLKHQAGELFKAAGGVAGAFGKLAMKKGSELKDKIDTEELQEKAASGFKSITSKAADSASRIADKATEKMEEIKQNLDEASEKKSSEKLVTDSKSNKSEDLESIVSEYTENEQTDATEIDVDDSNKAIAQDVNDIGDDGENQLLNAIKAELKERKIENQKIRDAVKAEEKRLAKERSEAKKSAIRKIKAIDNLSTKREIQKDEKKLAEFQEKEALKIATARSERSKTIVKQNKKGIGIIAAVIVGIIAIISGGVVISGKAKVASDYKKGVEYIISEEYSSAVEVLADLDYEDAKVLKAYAVCQFGIESYKGKPGEMIDDLKKINGVENAEVKEQYDDALIQLNAAKEVQEEINNITIASVDSVKTINYDGISDNLEKIPERYRGLVITEKYDKAKKLLEYLDKDTDVAKLIDDIASIGEVTLDSEDALKELRSRYTKLSVEEQSLIINLSELAEAEAKYNKLKAEKEEEEERQRKEKEQREEEERQAQLEADAEAYAANARDNMTVIVTSTGKYHVSGCSYIRSGWEDKYGNVKNTHSPCFHCFPDTYCERAYESYKKEYIDKDGNI